MKRPLLDSFKFLQKHATRIIGNAILFGGDKHADRIQGDLIGIFHFDPSVIARGGQI